ncbi:MAG TPA: hypothetical protein DCP91_07275 [Eggerthellaceae bacterium]|nr:hypothetical protein [Eggerthellaceae bacterium]
MQQARHPISRVLGALLALAMALLIAAALASDQALAAQDDGLSATRSAQKQGLDAQASSAKVENAYLVRSGEKFSKKTVKKYDITGNGKPDAITFVLAKSDDNWAETLRIYVNGKLCRTVKGLDGNGFFPTGVTAKYLRMKNGAAFLFVKCDANNGDGSQLVLQYHGKRLSAVASANSLPAGYGNHRQLVDAIASGNTVRATYRYMTMTAGAVEFTYTYKMKNGKLLRTGNTTSILSYGVSNGPYRTGKLFAPARVAFSAFTNTTLNTVKYRVSAGQKVKISRVCMKQGKLFFRMTTEDGDSGWIEALKHGVGSKGTDTLLIGTYLAG